jgi:hypothetical protein
MKQEYSSAKSCVRKVPAGFRIVDKYFGWKPHTTNLDIGGGKYDLMTNKLNEKSVTNLLYDPYNRSEYHNKNILTYIKYKKVDTVTIFNVLNVIKEHEIQVELIKMGFNALKLNGMIFVRSIYKNPKGVSGVTKSGTFQHYLQQEDYLKIVQEVIPNAVLKYGIISAKKYV